jgi:AcrR family transcriptional regulator
MIHPVRTRGGSVAKSTGKGTARTPLSLGQIAAAALDVIDELGQQDFSLRLVARRLGVTPMSLYWHVEDRGALLSLVAERVMRRVEVPDVSLDWRERLRQVATGYRDAVRRHPHVAQLIASSMSSMSPGDLAFMESVFAALVDAGVQEDVLVDAYNAYVGALVGFVAVELAEPSTSATWTDRRDRTLAKLDPETLPTLVAHRPLLDGAFGARTTSGLDDPKDKAFHLFLDLYVAGLESGLGT